MPPILPSAGDLVSGFFNSFLDIFREAGQESMDMAVEALLLVDRPDFTAEWFVKLYAILFGFGFVMAILCGLVRGLAAVFNEDAHGFFKTFLLPLKHFFLGSYLPYLFTLGFALSAYMSQALAGAMPAEDPSSDLELIGFGTIASDMFFFPFLVIQGIFFNLLVYTIQWVMPFMTVLFFVVMAGFSDMSAGSKVWNVFLSLSITSIFSQFFMTLSVVISSWVLYGIQDVTEGAVGGLTFGYWLCLTVTMLLPYFVYKGTRKRVQTIRALGAMRIDGQIRSVSNIQQSVKATPGKPGIVRTGSVVMGDSALDKLKEVKQTTPRVVDGNKTAAAVSIAAKSSKVAAASGTKAASAAAGPMAAGAMVGASLLMSRSKQEKKAKEANP